MYMLNTLTKQWNLSWCAFTEQTTGPATHHDPAAGGNVALPPVQAPTPGSTSTSGSITPPAMPSTSANLIDLNSPTPTPIQGLMAHLNINN